MKRSTKKSLKRTKREAKFFEEKYQPLTMGVALVAGKHPIPRTYHDQGRGAGPEKTRAVISSRVHTRSHLALRLPFFSPSFFLTISLSPAFTSA
jgi:hypothetical protein